MVAVSNSVANNGRSSAIAEPLKALVGKKNVETTKMTDQLFIINRKIFISVEMHLQNKNSL